LVIGIIKIALTKPLTFIVMAITIALFGVLYALNTPVDIFPNIGVPVIATAWQYTALSPDDMAGRIVAPFERVLSTTVNDVEHIESQSMQGIGIVKIFFHPTVNIQTATAQVTSVSQSILKQLPPGITPPLIINYSASTVPILQLALSGQGLSEQRLFDIGQIQMRPRLVTVAGAALPFPSGGKVRQVQIDVDPAALQAVGLSAQDVGDAITAQNQITPAGFAKIGTYQYNIQLNNAPGKAEDFNDLPVKTVNEATIYLRDVAHVRDGSPPQQSVVHVDGTRSVLLTVFKNGATSTLAIIQGIRDLLPQITATLPSSLKVTPIGDQSLFVRAAIQGVVKEGGIAAVLTSLMILLFLGSWRSTVIIAISIPLSILFAIIFLGVSGNTLNIMTLGGLSLAVGILVDNATVTIENINHHLEEGAGVQDAILHGAGQIVAPAFVALLCICIVFVPMFFLPGVAGFLFVPLAWSVIFAMIGSFIISFTLVPTLAMYLLKPRNEADSPEARLRSRNPLARWQARFALLFERIRTRYGSILERVLAARTIFVIGFLGVVILSLVILSPFLGRNFFPTVDSGQITLHVRAPVGTRIEDTAAEYGRIEGQIRKIIPPAEVATIVDNIGLPVSALNSAYNNSGTTGSQEGDILMTLKERHHPSAQYIKAMREQLPRAFPGASFGFLPADITSQILNFGSPTAIDVQVTGSDTSGGLKYTQSLLRRIRTIAGVADARIQQSANYPQLRVSVDRTRIGQFGLTERDVTTSLSNALAGTSQTAPVFALNSDNGVSYAVAAQAPEYRVRSVSELNNIPVTGPGATQPQILGGISTFVHEATSSVVSHYNIQPTFDVYAATSDRDLGAVAADISRVLEDLKKEAPKGTTAIIRGQYATMTTAFSGLFLGLLGAVVLIYLLIVVNFQSWLDPFVIITALPGALAGIVWLLFLTETPLSVPALIGAIMSMGVATANSILVVSFARERLDATGDALKAALESGIARFRPVVMTALAMVTGMLPMSLGLGEGGEQNAPLGRAVIGGLLVATVATLLFVPVIFSIVHRKTQPKADAAQPEPAHA
jgi:CzcA family heavy metal efflux pump